MKALLVYFLSGLAAVLVGCGSQDDLPGPVKKPFECRWATSPIEIDGKADEPAWQQAETIDHFSKPWLAGRERAVKAATRARLLWDRQYLYFFASLDDKDLFADITTHDAKTWFNDVFELFLRPAADKPGYYEFQVNAANTQLDMFIPKWEKTFFEKCISARPFHITSAVVHQGTLNVHQDRDQGWSVEGKIPWTDFVCTGGRPVPGEQWRFALCRYDYIQGVDEPEHSTCAPLTKANFHRKEDYAPLEFVGKVDATLDQLPAPAPWTTSKVAGSPEPPLPFRVERVFKNLKLELPICLRVVPGTDQMLIVDEPAPYAPARLLQANTDPDVDSYQVLIDYLPSFGVAYDITFHPNFADNGFVFIGSNFKDAHGGRTSCITRYQMEREPPFRFDVNSAKVIIEWPSDGHNGGAVVFGNDGMLYVTSGDGTSDSDKDVVGQRLDLLTSKVLRIDVDHPEEGRNYSIPADNPFLEQPDARPETWAYGLRNPWRIAVDRKTGHLWVGNNGQDLWEQAYLVERGANYGWSVFEGSHPFYANRQRGPTPILPPTVEHSHAESRSLTGGLVYYGTEFPELVGAYIYGDYETGKIWAVKHDGDKILWQRELANTTLRIACFSEDDHGELLIADQQLNGESGFYRLRRNQTAENTVPFPQRLSETGLFVSVAEQKTQPGVISYSINAPAWNDGAVATHYLAIPAQLQKDQTWKTPLPDWRSSGAWEFPDGTVLVQNLALELQPGSPASRRWVETRLLTRQQTEWEGYSYLWNQEQTDAQLVGKMGATVQLPLGQGPSSTQRTWHVPSRSDCKGCHSRAASFVIGLTTPQLNRLHEYDGQSVNQLRYFEQHHLFKVDWVAEAQEVWRAEIAQDFPKIDPPNLEESRAQSRLIDAQLESLTDSDNQRQAPTTPWMFKGPAEYPKLVDPNDPGSNLTKRARSYLDVNCACCHVFAGGGNARMVLRFNTPIDKLGLFGEKPLHGDFGLADARLIAPGAPHRSVLNYRVSTLSGGRMPRVGSHQVDLQGICLLRDWIGSLPDSKSGADPITRSVAQLVDGNNENVQATIDQLLGSTSGALAAMDAIDREQFSPEITQALQQTAFGSPRPEVRRLFERYLSEEARKERLGPHIQAEDILTLQGNAARGEQLFLSEQTLTCLKCHRYQDRGQQVGPDLAEIGSRDGVRQTISRGDILESLLDPSRKIDEKYAAYVVLTETGQVITGVISKRTSDVVVIQPVDGKRVTIQAEEIDELTRQTKSIMPDHLLQDLTAQEAADLVAFLHKLSQKE
ncbi:MAG: PQQ-dependent sugar dehydrogenase [Mariniblastus sp.]|nr:PQQ-dependent sugar dehydrogenase [Mariniblastus sp.]